MRKFIRCAVTLSCLLTVAACSLDTVYCQYRSVPTGGLDRSDTLSFDIPPLREGGCYREEVGVRTTADYLFTDLVLIVDQTAIKTGKTYHDTLYCPLTGRDGNINGGGVSHYQYRFPLTTLSLAAGDSLHITVRHGMKREVLPGITDIGIALTRQ